MILVAFFIADWEVGIGTILGGSVATLIEMVREYNLNQSQIKKKSMTISNEVNDTKINHIDNIEFQNSSFDYILGI